MGVPQSDGLSRCRWHLQALWCPSAWSTCHGLQMTACDYSKPGILLEPHVPPSSSPCIQFTSSNLLKPICDKAQYACLQLDSIHRVADKTMMLLHCQLAEIGGDCLARLERQSSKRGCACSNMPHLIHTFMAEIGCHRMMESENRILTSCPWLRPRYRQSLHWFL